ncbi:MAG: hypothetical protein U0931_13240 [Vulcanimicrobiota bacterium]
MPFTYKKQAFGLPEVLVGLFILFCGLGVVVRLFHSGMRYSARTQRTARGAMVARKHLERARGWLHQTANWDAMGSYPGLGSWVQDGDCPEYEVRVELLSFTGLNPCTTFESSQPGTQRSLTASYRRVKVSVRLDGKAVCDLASLVGEPRRTIDPSTAVQITAAGPTTLSQNGTLNLSVQLKASDGTVIQDQFFHWRVAPGTGNGTVVALTRDGRSALFTHKLVLTSGRTRFVNGQLFVKASTRYYGQPLESQLGLTLGP